MKNYRRGLVGVLFVIGILLFVGTGFYFYSKSQNTLGDAVPLVNDLNKGKILPIDFVAEDTNALLQSLFGNPTPTEYPSIKYYDDHIIIAEYPSIKGCAVLWVYDRRTSTRIPNGFGDQDGCGLLLSDSKHLIVASDSKIFIWTIGDNQPSILAKSQLTSGETYTVGAGMGSQVDATLSESWLTAKIYRDTKGESNGTPIRTAEFKLP